MQLELVQAMEKKQNPLTLKAMFSNEDTHQTHSYQSVFKFARRLLSVMYKLKLLVRV